MDQFQIPDTKIQSDPVIEKFNHVDTVLIVVSGLLVVRWSHRTGEFRAGDAVAVAPLPPRHR